MPKQLLKVGIRTSFGVFLLVAILLDTFTKFLNRKLKRHDMNRAPTIQIGRSYIGLLKEMRVSKLWLLPSRAADLWTALWLGICGVRALGNLRLALVPGIWGRQGVHLALCIHLDWSRVVTIGEWKLDSFCPSSLQCRLWQIKPFRSTWMESWRNVGVSTISLSLPVREFDSSERTWPKRAVPSLCNESSSCEQRLHTNYR